MGCGGPSALCAVSLWGPGCPYGVLGGVCGAVGAPAPPVLPQISPPAPMWVLLVSLWGCGGPWEVWGVPAGVPVRSGGPSGVRGVAVGLWVPPAPLTPVSPAPPSPPPRAAARPGAGAAGAGQHDVAGGELGAGAHGRLIPAAAPEVRAAGRRLPRPSPRPLRPCQPPQEPRARRCRPRPPPSPPGPGTRWPHAAAAATTTSAGPCRHPGGPRAPHHHSAGAACWGAPPSRRQHHPRHRHPYPW